MSNEAQERKDRSIAKLVEEGVPFHQSLPCIETEEQCSFRSRQDIVQRSWALYVVLAKAFGADEDSLREVVSERGIIRWLSPREREFLTATARDGASFEQTRTQITWRYESLWVLLWALGFVAKLKYPSAQCDPNIIEDIFSDNDIPDFLNYPINRSPSVILDEADLIYRYHWVVRDAQLAGRPVPVRLDPSVVCERHYALNWLIGYQGQEWDDITTDT